MNLDRGIASTLLGSAFLAWLGRAAGTSAEQAGDRSGSVSL